jgi:membrane protease YdiL (CAAX protease family)
MDDSLPPSVPYSLPEPFGPAEPAPPRPPEVWGGWATFGFGLVILIMTVVIEGIIGAVVLGALLVSEQLPLDDLNAFMDLFQQHAGIIVAISVIVNAVIGLGLMYLIIRARRGLPFWHYLGFRKIGVKALGLALLAFAVYFGLNLLVEQYSASGTSDSSFGFNFYDTSTWPVLVWLSVCVIGPFYEEMWIRGFMFAGMIRSRLALSGTLIVTSMFWAVQHIQYSWLAIGMIFLFGLALGYMRYRSDSIWPSIIVHVINNTIALALLTAGV